MVPTGQKSTGARRQDQSSTWRGDVVRPLRAWYRRHRRDLPWRRTSDPYAIWVSEIMLQQTQVATVIGYFERFLAAFPDIAALAAADEREVLGLWEGLGYYRRARQMHAAARLLVDDHDAVFPRELEQVQQLPGIGRYTAGAIVSIAFDKPAPILEANTVRLFSRLIGFRGDPASVAGQKQLWRTAENVLPARGCGEINQALMELGSLVCTPRDPDCGRCPLAKVCVARRENAQREMPRPRVKPRIEEVREAAVVLWRGPHVLLRQRPHGERWAGLWDFLRFPLAASKQPALDRELAASIREQSGLRSRFHEHMATLKHGVTRFRITLDCYHARCQPGRGKLAAGTWRWVKPDELAAFPLSVTGRKVARMIAKRS
jgi:A/G-specific adenine glycosylase